MLTVPGGGCRPEIFEAMYWLTVVVMSIRSPEEFSRIRVKNMGVPPYIIKNGFHLIFTQLSPFFFFFDGMMKKII